MEGNLITGDLQENTLTFEMKEPVTIIAGRYDIRKIEDKPEKLTVFSPNVNIRDIFNERIKNQLNSIQVYTVRDLVSKSTTEISSIRNLDKISLRKIQEALEQNDFKLND